MSSDSKTRGVVGAVVGASPGITMCLCAWLNQTSVYQLAGIVGIVGGVVGWAIGRVDSGGYGPWLMGAVLGALPGLLLSLQAGMNSSGYGTDFAPIFWAAVAVGGAVVGCLIGGSVAENIRAKQWKKSQRNESAEEPNKFRLHHLESANETQRRCRADVGRACRDDTRVRDDI